MFNTWNLPQLSCTWTTLKKIKIKLYWLHNFLLTSTRQQRYHNLNIIAFLTIKLYKNMANVFKLNVKNYQSRSKRGLKENKKSISGWEEGVNLFKFKFKIYIFRTQKKKKNVCKNWLSQAVLKTFANLKKMRNWKSFFHESNLL